MGEDESKNLRIASTDGVLIEVHVARPGSSMRVDVPGLVLLHGFPSSLVGAEKVGSDFYQLADRIADEMGWLVASVRMRGCGTSTGDFSLGGWVDDARAALEYLRFEGQPDRLWICGFGTGGAIALAASVNDPSVTGVATLGTPADFKDWAQRPEQLLEHARGLGVIESPGFPSDFAHWSSQLSSVSGLEAAEAISDKGFLAIHGFHDEVVPVFDARLLADGHGEAELHIISGAGHQLRNDPRAIAVLLGWLDRQRLASARIV